jgi:hypothetical protein
MNEIDDRELAISGPFGLTHDARGRLVLIDSTGARHVDVMPVRLFPISDAHHWISICDSNGRELAYVEDPATLSAASKQALLEELNRREFIPHIDQIIHVSSNIEPSEWTVETDRGRTRFILKNEDDVRRLESAI